MGEQKFHDESCWKRFERIYLHTAAVPTSAAPVLARDEVPEPSEAVAGTDASEAPAGAVAEEEAAARPSSSGVKRRDDDNGPDDARSAKRATTTAEDTEMETAERKRKGPSTRQSTWTRERSWCVVASSSSRPSESSILRYEETSCRRGLKKLLRAQCKRVTVA